MSITMEGDYNLIRDEMVRSKHSGTTLFIALWGEGGATSGHSEAQLVMEERAGSAAV